MPFHQPSRRQFVRTAALGIGSFATGLASAEEKEKPLAPPDRQPPDLDVPEIAERPVGWAVVGLGKLALEEVMPAFSRCKLSRVTALVSGHPDKAKKGAQFYGVKARNLYDYDTFDKLADNPDVDVVYIILPNSKHAEYTLRSFKAGKHVLCEKPMAVTVQECEEMIAAARQARKKLMIAYRLHYEPFNRKVMELCAKKAFGEIKTISSSNCQDVKAPNIRLSRKLGGGPLGDVGIYSINATRYITRQEPVEVVAFSRQPKDDPRFREVPESLAFSLRFPDGVLAHCDCSFASAEGRRYCVHCADGLIDLDPAFSYRGLRLYLTQKERHEEVRLREVDHFAAEMDHFSQCIRSDRDARTPGEEGLADMRVMAAIEEATRTGKTVRVSK